MYLKYLYPHTFQMLLPLFLFSVNYCSPLCMETAGVQSIKQTNLIKSTFAGLFRVSKIALTKELIRFNKNAYGD